MFVDDYGVVYCFGGFDGVDGNWLFLYDVVFGGMLDWDCVFGDDLEFVVLDCVVWFECGGVVYCLVLCVGVLLIFGEGRGGRCWVVGRVNYCFWVG